MRRSTRNSTYFDTMLLLLVSLARRPAICQGLAVRQAITTSNLRQPPRTKLWRRTLSSTSALPFSEYVPTAAYVLQASRTGGFSQSESLDREELRQEIRSLDDHITILNSGRPLNVQSPSQVAMAIFGGKQKASRSILEAATTDVSLEPQQRELAELILQCRQKKQQLRKLETDDDNGNIISILEGHNGQSTSKPTTKAAPTTHGASKLQTIGDTSQEPTNNFSPLNQRASTPIRSPPSYEQMVNFLFDQPGTKIDEYWLEPLLQFSRTTSRDILKQLDATGCPMGFDPAAVIKGQAKKISSAGKKGTFLDFCRTQKGLYPKCVLLVRMGDFYETYGVDALLLMEHAGLNPMAGKARAGCPHRSVQPTLNALTEQGFSVAVFEEVGQTSTNKLKTRVLSQIVSPASPTYLYDNWLLGDSEHSTLDRLPPSRPCVGLVHTAAGYHMMEVSLEERSIRYSDRLTPEAVACRLAAYPPADPLIYIPSPNEQDTQRSSALSFLLQASSRRNARGNQNAFESHLGGFRVGTKVIPPHLIPLTTPDGKPIPESSRYIKAVVDAFVELNEQGHEDDSIGDDNGIVSNDQNSRPTLTDFRVSEYSAATNPLYLETARQLGLIEDPAIPSLISNVLDDAAPATTRNYLRRYLLVPPPPEVAQAMATLVKSFMNPDTSPTLPPLTVPPLGKILSLIRAGQASANVYGELLSCLSVTRFVLDDAQNYQELPVEALLTLSSRESGLATTKKSLTSRCEKLIHAIETVVNEAHHVDDHYGTGDRTGDLPSEHQYVPTAFFDRNEASWRGRVQPAIAEATYNGVTQAAKALGQAIKDDFIMGDDTNKAQIVQDIFNNLLVLRKVPSGADASQYVNPRDRNGKLLSTRYTTKRVQDALSEYVTACKDASTEIATILSDLAKTLMEDGHIPAIVQSVHMNVALSVAFYHTVKAMKQNWYLAETIERETTIIADKPTKPSCLFVGLWPYWMPESNAVKNSFDMSGMFLLTAPNMSGKSTLMRSTAAAALLTTCGLCAPLGPGSEIPRFDTLFLRGASADVPAENKSAFGAEMEDIAALMRCCGKSSLVFVDEIGRGTSPRDGTRLAAAILEAMADEGMSGIFATHLHEILELPLSSKEPILNKRMAVEKGSSLEWTYRLEDGVCSDSLALVTASRFGLPDGILRRAEEFDQYLDMGEMSQDSPRVDPVEEARTSAHQDAFEEEAFPTHESKLPRKNIGMDRQELERNFLLAKGIAEEMSKEKAIVIPPRHLPPPTLADKSCLYVLQLSSNPPRYYVGESDNISQRLSSHRAKGSIWNKCIAAVIPLASKSEARHLESCLIQGLAQAGFSMQSTADGRSIRRAPRS